MKQVNGERLAPRRPPGHLSAYPGFITVAGTSRCNIRCEFCINQWDALPDGSNRPHMKAEHVQAIVAEVFPYIRKLALSVSGEPLYDPHFQELLDAARKYGVFVEFTTNAMLVSKPGMLDRILQGVGRVNISMDGATPSTYERLRTGSKFDKVCENIRLLTGGRAPRPAHARIQRPLHPDAGHHRRAAHDGGLCRTWWITLHQPHPGLTEELKTSRLHHKARGAAFARARASRGARPGGGAAPGFDLTEPKPLRAADPMGATVAEAADGQAWAGTGAVERADARPAELPPAAYTGRCPYLWDQAFFEADGSVFPCCNSGGVAMGHLDRAPDFWSIWTGETYEHMRAAVYTPQCHDICVNCYLREGTRASEAFVRPVQGAGVGGWGRLRRALGLGGRSAPRPAN